MKKVKKNLASAKELDVLPGVGSTIVRRIADVKEWFGLNPKMNNKTLPVTSILSFPKRQESISSETKVEHDYGKRSSPAKSLTNDSILAIAQNEGIDAASIHAVIEVESSGKGYLDNGNPKILFEGHVFWRELKAKRLDPKKYLMGNSDILYPHWNKRHYRGGMGEYDRLNKAVRIHKECALRSTSWGMFQIMGFNYRSAGYSSVESFVQSNYISEYKQLESFINFVKSKHLIEYIQKRDWVNFAKGYNGNGYKANRYDERLSHAYRTYKKSTLA